LCIDQTYYTAVCKDDKSQQLKFVSKPLETDRK